MHRLRVEQLNGAKVKRTDDFRHDTQIPRALIVSVDEIERRTGLDLFSALPKDEQDRLEAKFDCFSR